ncbi:hypothetical protein BMF35_a2118 [Aurantiacibacter gangjinensis]|nr:hypothetical protein BMF35_a2118 [Aurantiacibacter gangjinensis]
MRAARCRCPAMLTWSTWSTVLVEKTRGGAIGPEPAHSTGDLPLAIMAQGLSEAACL